MTMPRTEGFVVLRYGRTSSYLDVKWGQERNSSPRETPSSESHLPAMRWNYMWKDQSSKVAMSGGQALVAQPADSDTNRLEPATNRICFPRTAMDYIPSGFEKLLELNTSALKRWHCAHRT